MLATFVNNVSPVALDDDKPSVVVPVNNDASIVVSSASSALVSKFDTNTFSTEVNVTALIVLATVERPDTETLNVSLEPLPVKSSPAPNVDVAALSATYKLENVVAVSMSASEVSVKDEPVDEEPEPELKYVLAAVLSVVSIESNSTTFDTAVPLTEIDLVPLTNE